MGSQVAGMQTRRLQRQLKPLCQMTTTLLSPPPFLTIMIILTLCDSSGFSGPLHIEFSQAGMCGRTQSLCPIRLPSCIPVSGSALAHLAGMPELCQSFLDLKTTAQAIKGQDRLKQARNRLGSGGLEEEESQGLERKGLSRL